MLKMKESTQMTYKFCYGITGRWGGGGTRVTMQKETIYKSPKGLKRIECLPALG